MRLIQDNVSATSGRLDDIEKVRLIDFVFHSSKFFYTVLNKIQSENSEKIVRAKYRGPSSTENFENRIDDRLQSEGKACRQGAKGHESTYMKF